MSLLQDPNPKSFWYTKNFHTKSLLEVDAIKARNLVKTKSLPKFNIVSEDHNFFTVALNHYEKNGLEEIFNSMEDNKLFKKHILSVFHASLLIQNLFGKFFLTDDKIRADREGNVVLWFNKNYELSIPFFNRKTPIQVAQYKRKFHEYLNKIRWILKKKILEKSPGERFLDFDQNLDFIKKSLQFQDLDKMTIQLNMEIQKYQSEFNKIKEQNSKKSTIQSLFLGPYQNENSSINPFKKGQSTRIFSKTQKKPEQATKIEYLKSIRSLVNNFQCVLLNEQTQMIKETKQKSKSQQTPSLQNIFHSAHRNRKDHQQKVITKTVRSYQSFINSTSSNSPTTQRVPLSQSPDINQHHTLQLLDHLQCISE